MRLSMTLRVNLGRLFIHLMALICICVLIAGGCAVKLFEYPVDHKKLKRDAQKTNDKKVLGLIKSLEIRSVYSMEEEIDKSVAGRFIRRDLQDCSADL